jgi:heme/copper-type cytochrome/quinol oxidase subunit 2
MHVLATHLLDASMHVAGAVPATPPINLESPTKIAIEWGWFKVTAANLVMFALVVLVFLFGILVPYRGNKKIIAAAKGEASKPAVTGTDSGAGAA